MGTSSSNGGPSGVSSLLPSWYSPSTSSGGVSSASAENNDDNGSEAEQAMATIMNRQKVKMYNLNPIRIQLKTGLMLKVLLQGSQKELGVLISERL